MTYNQSTNQKYRASYLFTVLEGIHVKGVFSLISTKVFVDRMYSVQHEYLVVSFRQCVHTVTGKGHYDVDFLSIYTGALVVVFKGLGNTPVSR